MQTQVDADEAVDDILNNLYDIKNENDEERDAFKARYAQDFADNYDTIEKEESGIAVPETSLACPDDAQAAQSDAAEFVANLDRTLTQIGWLTDQLQECCFEMETDYDGIRVLAEPQLAAIEA